MRTMSIDTLIKYLEDFKKNLVPGKPLYVKINGEIIIFSDKDCTVPEASI